ncbi:MAG: ATP-binding protein [Chloroflexi bacterium]|nr:ATP-binding protein [Chloroflexota bacterium]
MVTLDKPLYPDAYHLVAHKFDIDLQTANGLIGAVLLFLPNYQAKLSAVKVRTNSITIEVLLGTAGLKDVGGKVFAQNEMKTTHNNVTFNSQSETVHIGFSPTEMEVCLLNSHDGELLDQVWLRASDIGASSVIDESDPRAVELLVQQGEGEQLEFKPGKLQDSDREELAETAVAFTNRDGGRILVGVADDGRILGCFESDVENRVTKLLVDRCDPPVNVRVNKLLIEDKPVYLVIVQESTNKPHAVKGRGFFIRHGSNDYPMSRAELDEIISNREKSFPYSRL